MTTSPHRRHLLDSIPTARAGEWVNRFVDFLHEKYGAVAQTIKDTSALSGDVEKQLIAAIEDFNKGF